MRRACHSISAGLVFVGLLAVAWPAHAPGAEKVKIAVPGLSTAFTPLYHAQSAGYFAEEGLDVEVVVILGGGSLQAVLARDAQFVAAPGTYQLMVHEKGQRLLAVMSLLTRKAINLVMHKEAARQKGITDKSPLADKIRALKGLRSRASPPAASCTRCFCTTCSRRRSIPTRTSS